VAAGEELRAMPPIEDPPSLGEHLPRRAVSTLREWTQQTGVSDRLYSPLSTSQTNLAAASGIDFDFLNPPQSPSKSEFSLAPWPTESVLSTASAEPPTLSIVSSGETIRSEIPAVLPHPPTSIPSLADSSSPSNNLSEGLDVSEPIPIQGVQLLVPDGVEALEEEQPRPTFKCTFWFLNCHEVCANEDEWNTHCIVHFKGAKPPRSNTCPLCEAQFFDIDATESWKKRMTHLAEHMREGRSFALSRPEFPLFKYLWQQRIIGDVDYQELVGNYHLQHEPRPYVLLSGPSRARRQERDRLRPVSQTARI